MERSSRSAAGPPSWERFAREVERMRYRGGERRGYATRLHYFSEWVSDGERRGLVRDLGADLGGEEDARPLRFMSEHRASYPGLADDAVFEAVRAVERGLDPAPRRVVPAARIPEVEGRIETGDILANVTKNGKDWKLVIFDRQGNLLREIDTPTPPGPGIVASWRKYGRR